MAVDEPSPINFLPYFDYEKPEFFSYQVWGLVTTLMCCHVIQQNELTVLLHGVGSNAQEPPAEHEEGEGLPLPLADCSSVDLAGTRARPKALPSF